MGDPWWTSFFDRTYTRQWAAAGMFDRTQEEVAGIVRALGADRPLRILDVPCGFGRHSAALHAMGHDVTGVDLSADQLAIAREDHPGPRYVQGDMRHPPEGPFDAVLNLFSSIGYFEDPADDLAAIRAWHAVLAPGGTLLIETNHRDRIARIHTPGEQRAIGDTGAVESGEMDWVTGVMHSTVRLADGRERQFHVRTYSATALVSLVHAAGFVDVEAQGGWGQDPVGPDTRLLIMARRSG